MIRAWRRRSGTVSACTKSTARMPPARGGQDLLPGRAGRGAEPVPAARGICCTVKAATRWPSLVRSPCTRAGRNSSASRDQVISADRAVGASLSPGAVPLKTGWFGPRAARGTLEPPPVRDKNGLRRLRTVTAQESRSYRQGLRPARRSMNKSYLLYVLVDMQNLKRSEPVQPLDRRPRRVPSRGALAAVLFGVVVLAAFGHITAFLLFLLAGIAVLAAVLRRRRSGR
jgi:hypothetical protein